MAETGAGDPSSPEADRDFEPTAEHLIHDYDDEGTIEEEENLSSESGDNEELDDLQKEGDMPLEALLAMYGYGGGPAAGSAMTGGSHNESAGSHSEEEILNNHDLTLDKEEVARDVLKNDDGSEASTVDELMETVQPSSAGQLMNGSMEGHYQEDEEEDDEDEDYLPTMEDEVWKKSIQVGEDYQADIPDLSSESANKTTETTPSATEERLLWDPKILSEKEVKMFLRDLKSGSSGISSSETSRSADNTEEAGSVHDDEQALYTLLQSDFNIDEAVRRKKLQNIPPSDPLSLWSEEECQNFESGLRVYGKNFFAIHHNKVRTRSVGELVQFYYFWKKTERREAFCNRGRIEKKKATLTPGITDYTDRFIDRPDSEDESSTVSLPPVDCLCPTDQQPSTHDSQNSASTATVTTTHSSEENHHNQPDDNRPANAHPTFSLNTMDIVSSSTDILRAAADSAAAPAAGLVPAAGEKRSHDQISADAGEVITNGASNDESSWASNNKKACVSSSDEMPTGQSVAVSTPSNQINEVAE